MKNHLTESELYLELGALTKKKDEWEASIPYVSSLLDSASVKIREKALWLLGEMGLAYPASIKEHVPAIAFFCDSAEPLLRERALKDTLINPASAPAGKFPPALRCKSLKYTKYSCTFAP